MAITKWSISGSEKKQQLAACFTSRIHARSGAFMQAHRDLPKEEVIRVRKFFETCGITPAKFPL
jgi:hypothetical protein